MQNYVVGVDVGGTTIKLALFPVGERDICTWEITTPVKENIDTIWKAIAETIRDKFRDLDLPIESLKAAGIGLPGPIREDGFIPWCVNLGMGACYPGKELEKELGVPCAANNDANIAALGEVYYGAAKGYENAVLLTLGTGVGGGIIIKNKIISGNRGIGGEVGHFVVNPDEEEYCNCGNRGCLEQYASATGMVRTAKRILQKSDRSSALRNVKMISAKDVCDEARNGDDIAKEALETYGKYMGLALAHISLTYDPDVIVLGGGVSRAGQILIDAVTKYLKEYTHIAPETAPIVLATLGNDAGTYGAAALAQGLL